jgi:hypothetical protein
MLVLHRNGMKHLQGFKNRGLTENWDWIAYNETFSITPRIGMYNRLDAHFGLTRAVPWVNLEF